MAIAQMNAKDLSSPLGTVPGHERHVVLRWFHLGLLKSPNPIL